MTEQPAAAPLRSWLAAPMDQDVSEAIERLRHAPGVQHVAVMPDVHLAADVCVGVAIATADVVYPQAVGGDIGCGMLAVAFDAQADALDRPRIAGEVLKALARVVPARRRNRREILAQSDDLSNTTLSDPALDSIRRTTGTIEFATLGSGNHFLEFQADQEDGRLWLMIHSGSRALGQAIHNHHLSRAQPAGSHRLRFIDAGSRAGAEYLRDLAFARGYAAASRRAMAEETGRLLAEVLGARLCRETEISTDHNHVAPERLPDGSEAWVHRKGAMPARLGEAGVLPGSMGTLSFHIEGRGEPQALCSSAHGAGRALSRSAARSKVTERELHRQMGRVWYDARIANQLRDEAPSAYKDIRAVLRAQHDLVRVTRTLRPVLNYKGS